jgi:methylated-DNA-[protein]-cysteine S-methyltransferase
LAASQACRILPPVNVAYHMMNSPVGLLFLARTPKGFRYIEFMDRKSLKRVIASHEDALPGATWIPSLLELKPAVEQLVAYFNGGLVDFELPLDLHGSDFQLKVWKALRAVPFGDTRSYGDIAKSMRQPRSSRAVGLANQQNPLAIVVPCHRVIGADKSLGGYSGGATRKRWLLEHEAAHRRRLETQGEVFAAAGPAPRRTKR